MFAPYNLFLAVLAYLLLLFALAYYAEKKEKIGRSIVNNPYVYSLSLAVYCTSWTFYGSVGRAATDGLSFLTIYLGPTIMAAVWMIVLRKVIRIARAHRITTISDFIGARYGRSIFLSALVTVIAVAGIGPYLGLQIKAIITTFGMITGQMREGVGAGMFITMILGIFAVFFGARKIDSSERHGGLVFAIAFESIVKLAAFLIVGIFVSFFLFNGFGDIFSKIESAGKAYLLSAGRQDSYFEWTALLFLSMMAIMLLPRQFQMAVVENYNEDHVRKASWLFPLYLLLINLFVLPIALGGVITTGGSEGAESFMLSLPLSNGSSSIALIVFIGGFAAATGMVIVESVALSTMVMNSLVMPALVKFGKAQSLPSLVINIKRFVIMGIVFIGYFFAITIGEFYSLVDMGLKSFEAVSLFGPAFFIGLYWKKANKKAVAAGLIAGFVIWIYTLMIPATIKAGLLSGSVLTSYIQSFPILNPEALLGVSSLGKWSHTLFWSMLINLLLFFGISVMTKQSREEELQALVFVESYNRRVGRSGTGLDVSSLREVLQTYLGYEESGQLIQRFLASKHKTESDLSDSDIMELWHEAEKELSGAFGPGISALIFKSRFMLDDKDQKSLSESIQHITETMRLSKDELAKANRQLSYLKEFSENIIESAPMGIIIVDKALVIRYCNSEMQKLTGLLVNDAVSKKITKILPWFNAQEIITSSNKDFVVKGPAGRMFSVNSSLFKDPSGGFVIVFEDITEKVKMQEQLKQASKLAGIGKLTAGLSHEIGNPLASISSLVQELRSLDACAEENREFSKDALSAIQNHIERIAKIVRSLGDFARVSPPHKIPASVADILDQTISLVKYDKRFSKIELAVDQQDVPDAMVNADQIQQVFLNLILNALDAMPEGGMLSISIKEIDGYVELIFSDTGMGIDEEELQKIFDPFFTTKPYGRGTGLGLSICYGIINDHRGTLTVRSKKGEGAAFIIRLPVHLGARTDTDS